MTCSCSVCGAWDLPVEHGQPALTGGSTETISPSTSVIVVSYNGRRHLEKCIPSLLTDDRPGYELILVDNGSTDGSAAYVEQSFPRVGVIRSGANLGYGQGANLGAREAKGRYLAFLNQDTIVGPGWLEALISALKVDAQAGLAASKVLLLADRERINTCGNTVHYTGLTMCRGMGMACTAHADTEEVDAVSGTAFVIRRDLFESLGGFDRAFFLYMEDTDLSWRARLAGYRCLCVPSSTVLHDYALRFGRKKTFYQERNRYLMLLKSLRWRTLLVLLPALLLAEVVTWGFLLFRERQGLTNKVRAYAWVVKHWSEVMTSRRQVQALRRVRDRDLLSRCDYRLAYEQVAGGAVARLAHLLFDPPFFVLRKLALALIRW